MPQVGLEWVSTPSFASFWPQAWRSMWACALMPSSANAAARSIMRLNRGADNGAPPLRDEHEGRLEVFSLMLAQLAKLPAGQRVRARAVLDPAHV
jgi:hypothetical protein